MIKLLVILLTVASFGAGFYFDRWLHRPIVIEPNTWEPIVPADHSTCEDIYHFPYPYACQFEIRT